MEAKPSTEAADRALDKFGWAAIIVALGLGIGLALAGAGIGGLF